MKLTNEFSITKRTSDNAFYGEVNENPYVVEISDPAYTEFDGFYNVMRSTNYNDRADKLRTLLAENRYPHVFEGMKESNRLETAHAEGKDPKHDKTVLLNGIKGLMKFFTEFSFTPSFRFVNTLSFKACQSMEKARNYVANYFALMDSSYVKEVKAKLKCDEFTQILKDIAQYGKPTEAINARFKVYFGPAGTGKTTVAQKEASNRCIVCNSSMLPSDLMEDFIFKDGNPDFNPSLLWDCMEKGETIVLDEINLLPFDSLRFLQGIVDGKTEFYYKNRPVHIHDGFQIIGTMNLSLGGMVYGLPEPLVDRCSDAEEYTLTAQQLAKSIMGWDAE